MNVSLRKHARIILTGSLSILIFAIKSTSGADSAERKVDIELKQQAAAEQIFPLPYAILNMVINPYSIRGIILSPHEETLMQGFTAEQRQDFAEQVWQKLPPDIQEALTTSNSVEYLRQTHMIFLRTILDNLPRLRGLSQVDAATYAKTKDGFLYELVTSIVKKIKNIDKDNPLLKKASSEQSQHLIHDFITRVLVLIKNEDELRAGLKKNFIHNAMLYRLTQMLTNAQTDPQELALLSTLVAESLNSPADAYNHLAALVTYTNRIFAPFYSALQKAKFWVRDQYPWNEQYLKQLAQSLVPLIDPYQVLSKKVLVSFKDASEQAVTQAAQRYIQDLYELIKSKNNTRAAYAFIHLVQEAAQEQRKRQEAEQQLIQVPKQEATRLLNDLVEEIVRFGVNHAYESLVFAKQYSKLYPYWFTSKNITFMPEWDTILSTVSVSNLLTEPTKMLIARDSVSDGMPDAEFALKKQVIMKLRDVYDQALAAKNTRALNYLLKLVTLFDQASHAPLARDNHSKEQRKILFRGYKDTQGKTLDGYLALLHFPEVQPGFFDFVPSIFTPDWVKKWREEKRQEGWIKTWHEAVQYWYNIPLREIL